MFSCNVEVIGYGDKSEEMYQKVVDFLNAISLQKGSIVTTYPESKARCAEHCGKEEPFLRIRSTEFTTGHVIAEALSRELGQAVECDLTVVFLPPE